MLSTVRALRNDADDAFVVAFAFGVGAAHERREQAGISHLLEHVLFEAADKRAALRALADVGAYNAVTHHDCTCYYARTDRAHAELAVRALWAVVSAFGRVSARELERERRVVLEEMARLQPGSLEATAERELQAGTPYGRPIIGTRASLTALDLPALRAFHAAHYAGAAVHAVVSCRCPRTRAAGARLVASLLRGGGRRLQPPPGSAAAASRLPVAVPRPQNHQTLRAKVILRKPPMQAGSRASGVALAVALGTAAPRDAADRGWDAYALALKRQLTETLRQQLGLVYGCDVRHEQTATAGVLQVSLASSAAAAAGQADLLVRATLHAVRLCLPLARDPASARLLAVSDASEPAEEAAVRAARRAAYAARSEPLLPRGGRGAVLVVEVRQRTDAAVRAAWLALLQDACDAARAME